MNARIRNLRRLFHKERIGAYVTFEPSNMRYLAGFGDLACALVTKKSVFAFAPPLLYAQARRLVSSGVKVVNLEKGLKENLRHLLRREKIRRVGYESHRVRLTEFRLLSSLRGFLLRDCGDLVAGLRRVKDPGEVARIRRACRITHKAYLYGKRLARPGVSEKEVASRLELFMKEKGAEKSSFDLIVAGGPNTALPHHKSGPYRFRKKDVVLFDIGCIIDGYCSDLTRTFFLGSPNGVHREVYRTVAEAQKRGISRVAENVLCREVDQAARRRIENARYGDYFIHSTGHGVGLEIHEAPRLTSRGAEKLQAGMVITVEPGIYLPGRFGVRIEDTLLVTKSGCEILTK